MKAYQRLALFLFNCAYPYKVYGKENIVDGKAIIVCNHFRAIDCGFVLDAYGKDVFFLAKKELFKKKLVGKIIRDFNGISIDREKPELSSITKSIKVLNDGHKLAIFPEGTRNKKDNELQEIKGGTAFFAVKAKCPIIPMMMLSKAKCFRKCKIMVGKPFELTEYYDKKNTHEDYAKMDEIIRQKMIEVQKELRATCAKKQKKNKKVKVEE